MVYLKWGKTTVKANIKVILYYTGYYLIAVILIVSGISKVIDLVPMIEIMQVFSTVGNNVIIIITTLIIIIEVTFGLLLLFKVKTRLVMIGILLLFTVFLIFSIYGTIVGMQNDCGCFGSLIESKIGWGMILRNAVFLAIVVIINNLSPVNIYKIVPLSTRDN